MMRRHVSAKEAVRFQGFRLPPRTYRRQSRSTRFCVALAVLSVLVLFGVSSLKNQSGEAALATTFDAGTPLPSRQRAQRVSSSEDGMPGAPQASALGEARTVAELRSFCRSRAPELSRTSWAAAGGGLMKASLPPPTLEYFVDARPVCVSNAGRVHVDPGTDDEWVASYAPGRVFSVSTLNDSVFAGRAAVAVPAMAILAKGVFIQTHIWHMLDDVAEDVTTFFDAYNGGEMWSVPTQTVLLFDRRYNWGAQHGNTKPRTALPGKMLNALSSPLHGGAFLPTSLTVEANVTQTLPPAPSPTTDMYTFLEADNSSTNGASLYCFCQAMSVSDSGKRWNTSKTTFAKVHDALAREFHEDGYQPNHTVQETEARRLRGHPWAGEYYRGDAFDARGVYRPRVLFVHRTERLIANAHTYAEKLREMGFRVEEVYPERLSVFRQFHLGRYADAVMGMHGLGIGHGFWMNRFPQGCRTVVEFRPWVRRGVHTGLPDILHGQMNFTYHQVEAVDVTFDSSIWFPFFERLRLSVGDSGTWELASFRHQTAFYNSEEVYALFERIKQHLVSCVPSVSSETTLSPESPASP